MLAAALRLRLATALTSFATRSFMKRLRRSLLLVLFVASAARVLAAELTVFAAASLSDALREIGSVYEKTSGNKIRFNFAASSLLARQIKEGAPADVFFSADELKMDDLSRAGLIADDTRRAFLSNQLVIVVHRENGPAIFSPEDLASRAIRRIALAEPNTVPAGIYASAYLEQRGLLKSVRGKILPSENVRACLAAVEAGNADVGFVYKTDALISKRVKIAFEVPAHEGPRISYPLAVLKDTRHADAARRFASYLASPDARGAFEKYGFGLMP